MIVVRQQRKQESRNRVLAKIRGNVTNPQGPVRRALVGEGRYLLSQWRCVLPRPTPMRLQNHLWRVTWMAMQGQQQIAVRPDVVRIGLDRALKRSDRLFDQALAQQHVGQVV